MKALPAGIRIRTLSLSVSSVSLIVAPRYLDLSMGLLCPTVTKVKFKSHYMTKITSSGKMSILELDNKGRLTLPKEIRASLGIGKKILVINAGDHLKVVPLPSNPLEVLHGAFNVKKPFRVLRKQAELTAENEARKRG